MAELLSNLLLFLLCTSMGAIGLAFAMRDRYEIGGWATFFLGVASLTWMAIHALTKRRRKCPADAQHHSDMPGSDGY